MTVRKRSSSLTHAEQQRYIHTVTKLNESGKYGELVNIHRANHHQHSAMAGMAGMGGGGTGRKRFLSWHRAFLLEFERELKAIENNAFIPYWDWTTEREVPPWIAGFTPTVSLPGFGSVTTERTPGVDFPDLPDAARIGSILKASTYASFTRRLELGPHGEVHEWVGGAMGNIMISPADPMFWMHHAQCDRLWSMWQSEHPGLGPVGLSAHSSIMDPWQSTVAELASIQTLGYSYGA